MLKNRQSKLLLHKCAAGRRRVRGAPKVAEVYHTQPLTFRGWVGRVGGRVGMGGDGWGELEVGRGWVGRVGGGGG